MKNIFGNGIKISDDNARRLSAALRKSALVVLQNILSRK